MSKQVALWVMIGGAAVSLYDLMGDANPVYGTGHPLAAARWKVYTDATSKKDWYISVSDLAALVGAYFYFK